MIQLILVFLKIGFLGFGGGYAMLSLIWNDANALGITSQQFADLNTLDLIAPGPIAVNSATYIGFITLGLAGAIAATFAVCTSSYVLSSLYLHYEEFITNNKYLNKIIEYTKIAAVGMIIAVACNLIIDSLVHTELPAVSIISILLTALLRFKLKVSTVSSLIITVLCGIVLYFIF